MLAPRVLGLFICSCFGLVSAATPLSLEGIPSCAIKCMLQSLPEANCSAIDQACLCTDTKFSAAVEPCIRSQCSVIETLATTNASYSQCGKSSRDETVKVRWVGSVAIAIASVFMAMRLTTKAAKLSAWGADDTCAIVAFVLVLAVYAESFYLTEVGFGKEVWTLHDYEITSFLKLLYFLQLLYLVQIALIKASILFFFLKIFPDRRFRQCLWIVQVLNLLICLAFVGVGFGQCRPFSYFWTGWDGEHEGSCLDATVTGLAHVALNIALDIIMLVLPVTQIYKLQMNRRKKIGVMAMFQAGIFLTIASILRIKSLANFGLSLDLTADSVPVALWTYVEMGVGVAVACMPSSWQLLRLIPSKVTQLTTTVATNTGPSGSRASPNSVVFPDKPVKMSLLETRSCRSNSTTMPSSSSPRRPSDYDEWKVGQAL